MSDRPVPLVDEWTRGFWEAAANGTLVVQRCDGCARCQYPPDLLCRHCQSEHLTYVPVSGEGRVYSFAVYTRSFSPGFEAPYVLALVDLLDAPDARMMTNIVDTPVDRITIGMTVEVTFEARGDWKIPQFRAVQRAA